MLFGWLRPDSERHEYRERLLLDPFFVVAIPSLFRKFIKFFFLIWELITSQGEAKFRQ